VTNTVDTAALDLLEMQGHPRVWVTQLLAADSAFICRVAIGGRLRSVCIGYESYGQVWEIGGVITPEPYRGQGYAQRVVSTAISVLAEKSLVPRYQAEIGNHPSLSLARRLGLRHFLTLEHHLHSAVSARTEASVLEC